LVFGLIGKPRLGYPGSHFIRGWKEPNMLRCASSLAGAASVPEFAIH
jgi:hypothetical protein